MLYGKLNNENIEWLFDGDHKFNSDDLDLLSNIVDLDNKEKLTDELFQIDVNVYSNKDELFIDKLGFNYTPTEIEWLVEKSFLKAVNINGIFYSNEEFLEEYRKAYSKSDFKPVIKNSRHTAYISEGVLHVFGYVYFKEYIKLMKETKEKYPNWLNEEGKVLVPSEDCTYKIDDMNSIYIYLKDEEDVLDDVRFFDLLDHLFLKKVTLVDISNDYKMTDISIEAHLNPYSFRNWKATKTTMAESKVNAILKIIHDRASDHVSEIEKLI